MEDNTKEEGLEGFEFWEQDRYLVIKSNKAYDTIKKVLNHYGLEIKIFNKHLNQPIMTDPIQQFLFVLKKANLIHQQPYFVLNLNKGDLEKKLVKDYGVERMGSQVDIAIIKKTDPHGKIYCPVCLEKKIISKLIHEGGCSSCKICGFSLCSG